MQYAYNVTLRRFFVTYSKYVSVTLVIQHAKRMLHIVFSSEACPAVPYFLRCLINGTIFGEKIIELEMCVLTPSTISV